LTPLGLGQGPVVGYRETAINIWGSIRDDKFLDYLSEYRFLNTDMLHRVKCSVTAQIEESRTFKFPDNLSHKSAFLLINTGTIHQRLCKEHDST
jgi:hypothetical protein